MPAIVQEIMKGDITWATGVMFCLSACAIGALGGALGGVLVGGRHIGYGLSAMLGMFFGPVAALPGVLMALIMLPLL